MPLPRNQADKFPINCGWNFWLAWYSLSMLAIATKRISSPSTKSSKSTTTTIMRTTIASGAGRNS